ncbi:MAG TPA: sugar phosphate isomerase/epimerase family protein [Planctomycetota bacterium]|nr:sugar phosphate isomerase/epimerase family protein [Planctomycetota bacterium]
MKPPGARRQRVGACSWSLQARGPQELTEMLVAIGVDCVQLHLDPLRTGAWPEAETVRELARAGIEIRSGMMSMEGEDYSTLESIRRTGGVRPSATWPANRAAAEANAKLARRLGLSLVTLHAGFLPHDRQDPERGLLLARMGRLLTIFGAERVRVGFETGQETSATLIGALEEVGNGAGVNFDPANMILYGMGDPVAALRALRGHDVLQLHIKDALPATTSGAWGEEVRVGTGRVDWPAFFAVVREGAFGDWMIEREAGSQRVEDMRAAREFVEQFL